MSSSDQQPQELAENAPYIAVVGMSGRFPKARDVEAYWRNIAEGRECISFFSPEEVAAAGVPEAVRTSRDFVPARAVIEDALHFDAPFFGFTPTEAELTDPQQRLFLECAWEALEHAGYDPARYPDLIGVYAGADVNTYVLGALSLWTYDVMSLIGNDKDYLATRVCYKLNLRGPGLTIQTACSTSLVAIQAACQGLLGFQCDMALAGGVGVVFPRHAGYLYQPGGIASPDGHCRPFDARARGTVGGDGVGVVVLKRFADALADGDTIHAVICGAAINNDGAQKVGFTAPSVEGQAEVITLALAMADVDPATIGYVECHGTATELGDPVEIAALTDAYRAYTDRKGYCAIGSVKSNVGHMNSAAGVGGLIKAILALKHKQLPPSLHYEAPNPNIDFANSPFYVNARLRPWEKNGEPRRAAVSSFGVGGTNAHVVLEEAPPSPPPGASRPLQLFVVSARSETALRETTNRLVAHLEAHPEQPLADVAYTLLAGRQLFKHRRMAVGHSSQEVRAALLSAPALYREPRRARVAFLFPGQGAQHVNMGRELYESEPLFRQEVDACVQLLRPQIGLDLREVLYPAPDREAEAAEQLMQTRLAQPALFIIEYALARLWMSWGIQPEAMSGHSVGEYVAASLAGVFSRDDALRLVATRGAMVQRLERGAMLAAALSEAEAARVPGVTIAALNAPGSVVLSGSTDAVDAAERELRARGVWSSRLHASHAFHSRMMEPVLDEFRAAVARTQRSAPRIPYISNLTGTWISQAEAMDPGYYARHLRHAVRFSDSVSELLAEPDRLLLEVGPGRGLTTLVGAHGPMAKERALASLGHPREAASELATLLTALGRLYLCDVPVDLGAFYAGQQRRRVPLPTYPFERYPYQYEASRSVFGSAHVPEVATSAGRVSPEQWLYAPSWKRSAPLRPAVAAGERWLVFDDGSRLAAEVSERLRGVGAHVVTVVAGPGLRRIAAGRYELDPAAPADYAALLQELAGASAAPQYLLHLWGAGAALAGSLPAELAAGFYSALFLVQALGRSDAGPTRLAIVTSGVADVLGDEAVYPGRAPLLALGQVVGQEWPSVRCRVVDVLPGALDADVAPTLAERLMAELVTDADEPFVAWRGGRRWVRTFEPLPPARGAGGAALRECGVYLIAGGLGRIGLALAEHLARRVRARLVLTARKGLGPREEWDRWLASHGENDRTSHLIRKVRELEALGAEVLVLSADVADEVQMRRVVEQTLQRFGALHGVVHAAGVTGVEALRALADTTPAHCEAHFHSKIQGLETLARVLPHGLDFCVVCSSLSTVLGGAGLGAYAAANHFMDAFVRARNQRGGCRWVAVDWDAWAPPEGTPGLGGLTALAGMAIRSEEGGAVFESALALAEVERIAVSTGELQARRERERRLKQQTRPASGEEQRARGGRARPTLETSYVEPRNEVERTLADIWQKVFGIESIGVEDNFFKLGGDSLLAIQLSTRLRDRLGVELQVNELFDVPTIAGLAQRLERLKPIAQVGQDTVAATLAMVENLSEEEVKRMLAEFAR